MTLAPVALIVCVCSLLAVGLTMLYSASSARDGTRLLLTQMTWCGLGLGAATVFACVDYRKLKRFTWPLYGLALVLLALVLVPGIGVTRGGARRWFDLGLGSFQPSELAKLALIFTLAWYGERFARQMREFKPGLFWPGCFVLPVLALICIEPDRGTTMLLAGVCTCLLLLAGVRWLYLLPPVVLGAIGFGLLLWFDPVRRARLLAFLEPELYKDGPGYQAWQAMLALGTGHWTGIGLGNGRQKLGFVPEHHTDFLFSVIGEEWGMLATLSVLVTFVVLVVSGVCIARNARDTFGLLLGAGITFLIGFQAFINIGVVTSSLPNKGLPLPFMSYGGSNLLMLLASVGLLLSISRVAAEQPVERPGLLDSDGLAEPEPT
jgi:cell division protein FtsW